MTVDPTLATLESLDDPNKFVTADNVPVFDEHDEYDDDGKLIRSFGEKELQTIADRCNARVAESGNVATLTLGHTLDDAPETEQPPVVGYARNFRVARFGPSQKLGLLATFHYLKDRFDEAKQYGQRSIEYWVKDKFIDTIALLKRTAERPLGVVTFRKKGLVKLRYSMADDQADRTENEADDQEYAKFRRFMKKYQDEESQQEVEDGEVPDKNFKGGNQGAQAAAMWAQTDDKKARVATKDGSAYDSDKMDGNWHSRQSKRGEVDRMQRDQESIRYSRMEAEVAAVKKENAEILAKYRRSARERDLIQLEAEGFQIDRAEELAAVENLEDAAYTSHLERVRKNYRRLPVGRMVGVFDGPVDPSGPGKANGATTKDQSEEAVKLAYSKKISFDEALREVKTRGKLVS